MSNIKFKAIAQLFCCMERACTIIILPVVDSFLYDISLILTKFLKACLSEVFLPSFHVTALF